MKFSGMLMVVKNMDVSRTFYQQVLRRTVVMDLDTYVVFEGFCLITEPQWAEFQTRTDLVYRYGNNVCELAFEEEEFDEFVAHFRTFPDIEIMCELREYEWGQRSPRFYDPDRHVVEVGEDMKTVTKRFLRSGMTVEQTTEKTMFPKEFVEMCREEMKGE